MVEWMDRIQNSVIPDVSRPVTTSKNQKIFKSRVKPWNGDQESPGHKYSREANEPSHRRTRRATRPKEDNKNTCSLFIQTDPLIWRHISEQVNLEYTRNYVFSFKRILTWFRSWKEKDNPKQMGRLFYRTAKSNLPRKRNNSLHNRRILRIHAIPRF